MITEENSLQQISAKYRFRKKGEYGKSINKKSYDGCIMVAVLLVCFGSMKLFADWCEKQVKVQKVKEDEES